MREKLNKKNSPNLLAKTNKPRLLHKLTGGGKSSGGLCLSTAASSNIFSLFLF